MENNVNTSNVKLRISQVFQLEKDSSNEYPEYLINHVKIHRVRLFGIIVSKFDKVEGDMLKSSFITLDDGSDTISLRYWFSESFNASTLVASLSTLRIGDICEVTGRIREFENEIYILLENISSPKSITWEIKQRLLQIKLENQTQNEAGSEITDEVLSILTFMVDNYEQNTVELIRERSEKDIDEVMTSLAILYNEGFVLCPQEGYYKKVN